MNEIIFGTYQMYIVANLQFEAWSAPNCLTVLTRRQLNVKQVAELLLQTNLLTRSTDILPATRGNVLYPNKYNLNLNLNLKKFIRQNTVLHIVQ